MMVPLTVILTALLVQSTWGYNEETYPLSDNSENSYLYPAEEIPEESDFEIRRRNNNNFLRFGRGGPNTEYDENPEDFARPTRSGKLEKSDYFIRFGRSKQDFLRFGRDPHRIVTRDRNQNHLRFGRSAPEENKRNKRDTYSDFKRAGSNFLRFGRNSNFMRFGRNDGSNDVSAATSDSEKSQQIRESPLIQLLSELIENIKKKETTCNRAV